MNPAQVSPERDWKGFSNIRYLFVFGDSYSAVGYSPNKPRPSDEEPLGVPFPGTRTWSSRDGDTINWVGYLVTEYSKSKLLVYDYAIGGNTVAGVGKQIVSMFLKDLGHKDSEVDWTAENSLFVTWVGINDIARRSPVNESLKDVFLFQESLYKAGARNFLFMNIPPLPRRRGAPSNILQTIDITRNEWNMLLNEKMQEFSRTHPRTTAFLFDAYGCFRRVLDDPVKYGFGENAGGPWDGQLYWDHIHPTSAFHSIVAKEVGEFLAGESSN